jgi:hypothetical protein
VSASVADALALESMDRFFTMMVKKLIRYCAGGENGGE